MKSLMFLFILTVSISVLAIDPPAITSGPSCNDKAKQYCSESLTQSCLSEHGKDFGVDCMIELGPKTKSVLKLKSCMKKASKYCSISDVRCLKKYKTKITSICVDLLKKQGRLLSKNSDFSKCAGQLMTKCQKFSPSNPKFAKCIMESMTKKPSRNCKKMMKKK